MNKKVLFELLMKTDSLQSFPQARRGGVGGGSKSWARTIV